MATSLRLRRVGNRNRPFYRVVVADKRSPRDGKFIETLGTYDPRKAGVNFDLKLERIEHWLGNGAKASDTVNSLINKARLQAEGKLEIPEKTKKQVRREVKAKRKPAEEAAEAAAPAEA